MSTNVQRTRQQQARRIADATGMSYTAALREVPPPEAVTPPRRAAARPTHVNAEDLNWERTWGHTLHFADPAREAEGQVPHHFAALVLPPEPGSRRKPWRLRLLPRGRQVPIVVDARRWKILPDPARLEQPPHYDYRRGDQLPAVLMTPRMLRKRLRKEPAKGQHSAGVLDSKWGAAELYYTEDAVDLADLKGKAATAWQRNRTCAECGKTRELPWPVFGLDGERVCPDCQTTRALRTWFEHKQAHCQQAQDWARGVLRDDAAVLVAFGGDVNHRMGQVRVVGTAGRRLFTADGMDRPLREWSDEEGRYVCVDPDGEAAWARAFGEFVSVLEGRRLVYVGEGTYVSDHDPSQWWSAFVDDFGLEPLPHTIAEHDRMADHVKGWIALPPPVIPSITSALGDFQPGNRGNYYRSWTGKTRTDHGVDGLIEAALALLGDMAAGAAPGLESGEDQAVGQ
jgi:hypothetical protein